jgi:hydroxymethylpyrimidine/phosphomethylpyrimidine kinase
VQTALTIAGSDSGAGAGLQADLKTFAAHRVYGTSVVTAVTAQNTSSVRAIFEVPVEVVTSQIDAVAADIEIHATKIGMLATAAVLRAVARALERWSLANVVLDPVMIATGGEPLLSRDAIPIMRSELLRLATVVTPNAAEAALLAEMPVTTAADARRAAERILAQGPRAVIITGGHLQEVEAIDVLMDASGCHELRVPRVETGATHGTGCTFAAAVAANLALGRSLRDSAEQAKRYVTGALQHRLAIGHGRSPLDHFWARDR